MEVFSSEMFTFIDLVSIRLIVEGLKHFRVTFNKQIVLSVGDVPGVDLEILHLQANEHQKVFSMKYH